MIKTILTPASGAQTDTGLLTAALAVARALGTHIDVLHVRFDPTEMAMLLANDGTGFSVTQDLIHQFERQASDPRTARSTTRIGCCAICGGMA